MEGRSTTCRTHRRASGSNTFQATNPATPILQPSAEKREVLKELGEVGTSRTTEKSATALNVYVVPSCKVGVGRLAAPAHTENWLRFRPVRYHD